MKTISIHRNETETIKNTNKSKFVNISLKERKRIRNG